MRSVGGRISVVWLCVLLAGCSGGSGEEPTLTPSPTVSLSSPPTTSGSPTPTLSPRDQAAADAEATVRHYNDIVNRLGQDPASPLSLLNGVTTSIELQTTKKNFRERRAKDWLQKGDVVIRTVDVQDVRLHNASPRAGIVPTVVLDVCYDVTEVDVVDSNGKSVVTPDRPDQVTTRLLVSNYTYAKDERGGWRVASGRDIGEGPCAK